jgi:phage head maturation protease
VGFRDALRQLFAAGDAQSLESRAHHTFSVNIPPEITEGEPIGVNFGRRVPRNKALQVTAVLRARNLIAGTLASLPLRHHLPDRRVERWPLFEQIDPDMPNTVVMAQTYEDLLFESIAWWRVIEKDARNWPMHARYVPTEAVHVASTDWPGSEGWISRDLILAEHGQVFIDGYPVPDDEIIRFDSPNPPLLVHAAGAIRACLSLDQMAELFAAEPLGLGYFKPDEGAELEDDEAQQIIDKWHLARRSHAWGYLKGLTPDTLDWDAEKLQMADQRKHAVLEIARAAGLDPEDLGVSTTSRTYQNSEQRRQDLVDFTLGAYVSAVQDRLSMGDVTPRGHYARIDFGGFLRSDTKTRMETYKIGREVGAYNDERIAELEDIPTARPSAPARPALPPAPSGEPPADEPPAEPEMEGNVVKLVTGQRFAAEGEQTGISFETAELFETFRVDREKRTISGLLVPWGKVANNGNGKWRFPKGSLYWVDEARVKLNLHHDRTQAVAYAARLQPLSTGLDATFKVARGAEGDRALSLAEDRVLDGFSIEIEFHDGDGWEPDPADRTIRNVQSAKLRGVALTSVPSFDDARVSAVAASLDHQKGMTMTGTTVDDKKAPAGQEFDFAGYAKQLGDMVAESHKQLTADLASSLGDSISAGIKAALETLPAPHGGDGPEPVRASRYTVTREAPVYAFNGLGHSLVRDAWYAGREQDSEAIERLRKYRLQTEEMAKLAARFMAAQAFAPQSTSTAADIIPPGYRPDLYVPELMQGRPLVSACSRGTIGNATPFVVPVFTSATGATGDHTEGTNPSDGTLDFGVKTVTPGSVSGRLTLTREIVDSSNPAIDQIALAAMRESYNQQTEAKVYTMVNGADGVGGTITAGFVPSGAQAATVNVGALNANPEELVYALRRALAVYPFRRFGAPTDALMGQNATVLLADAKDTTGRPLLPAIAPQNAGGLGNAITQGWSIDTLPHRPAWAMTGAGAGDAQVITLARPDVWVWESPLLTFRFEEKQGPANIELNVFGYFATHVLRPVGLSGVRITAT